MKVTIPAPVTLSVNGESYSLLDMVRHITGKEARFNREAEAARAGQRIVAALSQASGTADLQETDLRLLSDVVERPNCGWGAHLVNVKLPGPNGAERVVERRVHAPTAEYLPLIDAIAEAAKKLPTD